MDLPAYIMRPIIDEPDDDAHRLICADWLEEHGDQPRAQYIRTQVAIANLGQPFGEHLSQIPNHQCRECGALWLRYVGSLEWSLCSPACGQCCDNEVMGEQIVPLASNVIALLLYEKQLFAEVADAAMQADQPLWGTPTRVTGWSPNCLHVGPPDNGISVYFQRGFIWHVSHGVGSEWVELASGWRKRHPVRQVTLASLPSVATRDGDNGGYLKRLHFGTKELWYGVNFDDAHVVPHLLAAEYPGIYFPGIQSPLTQFFKSV